MNLESSQLTPKCVGFIMDGNRRWAKEHHLPSLEGHRRGYENIKKVMRWLKEFQIPFGIFYTFSTENWNRKKEEVEYLMSLFRFAFQAEYAELKKEGMKIKFIGDLTRFSADIRKLMTQAEEDTKNFEGPTVVFAMSYGGRDEIMRSVKKMVAEKGLREITKMGEADFSRYLDTKGMPDPDLIIRTSGEMRLSGFLPWQAVYSELFFTKTCWPALSKNEFEAILKEFASRGRRIGK